jgi:hypothetical protein
LIRALEENSKARLGSGYDIGWEEVNYRELGRNRIPAKIIVPTQSDALGLIGKTRDGEAFDALARTTLDAESALGDWIARKPLTLVANAQDWMRILHVLAWFKRHPRSGLYLRQLDVPEVDTKFIEARKGLLTELLDLVLPPEAIDFTAGGVRGFEVRYGLRTKPALIRFRILDDRHALAGLTDLTVPVEQFAALTTEVRRVFITENEVNGLVFPDVDSSLVIFGLGYALELLAGAPWLREREVSYWGDIDTHGFVMLDRLRAQLPNVRSFLMDGPTLAAHRHHWSVDGAPYVDGLDRLTVTEKVVYDDLRFDRHGKRVRLEQERISFGCVERAIKEM